MVDKIKNGLNLLSNMGWRYTKFRVQHELLRKTGILKKRFPVEPAYKQYISVDEWKRDSQNFFFNDKKSLTFLKQPGKEIEIRYHKIESGRFFFLIALNFLLAKIMTGSPILTPVLSMIKPGTGPKSQTIPGRRVI